MAYSMSEILNRKKKPNGMMAPPMNQGPMSPQQRKNSDKDRFRLSRRMEQSGQPAYPINPLGINRPLSPFGPQSAASRMAATYGTDYGAELNRFTAPDPMAYAIGKKAPLLADQEVSLGDADVRAANLANRGTRGGIADADIRRGFIAPELTERVRGLQLGNTGTAQGIQQRDEMFPYQKTAAGMTNALTGRDIERADIENNELVQSLPLKIESLKVQLQNTVDANDRENIAIQIERANAELEQARMKAETARYEQQTPIALRAGEQELDQGAELFRYQQNKAPRFDELTANRMETETDLMREAPERDEQRERRAMAAEAYRLEGDPAYLEMMNESGAPSFGPIAGLNEVQMEKAAGRATVVMQGAGLTSALANLESSRRGPDVPSHELRRFADALKQALVLAKRDRTGLVAQYIKNLIQNADAYKAIKSNAKRFQPMRYPLSSIPRGIIPVGAQRQARKIVDLVEG